LNDSEILNKFLEANLNLEPEALIEIKRGGGAFELIERIISGTKKENLNVITIEYLKTLKTPFGLEFQEEEDIEEPKVKVVHSKKPTLSQEYESEITIKDKKDITNKSFSKGEIENFIEHFQDRYEKLSRILKNRDQFRESVPISMVKPGPVKIIGMVNETRETKNGHLIIELEDPSGTMPVLVLKSNKNLLNICTTLVKDEVIGVEGNSGSSNDIIIANDVAFPDVPVKKEARKSEAPLAATFISDIHIGSVEFMEKEFSRFLKWLKGELGDKRQRELSNKVKYLLIGGDLVDGVGIYPGQEKELVIKDIREQYKVFSDKISQIPDHIEILIIPGNHDATRQAEPQPAILEEFAPELYEKQNIHMGGSPTYTKLHGVEVLMYHGRSLDDVFSNIPNLSFDHPETPMVELLKKRHLAPIYGGKVPLSPEAEDYLVIEEVPDIIHFGHIHTVGVENYRGTLLLNSGSFQSQTSFQKKVNIVPDPARIPVVDLQTYNTTLMRFI